MKEKYAKLEITVLLRFIIICDKDTLVAYVGRYIIIYMNINTHGFVLGQTKRPHFYYSKKKEVWVHN